MENKIISKIQKKLKGCTLNSSITRLQKFNRNHGGKRNLQEIHEGLTALYIVKGALKYIFENCMTISYTPINDELMRISLLDIKEQQIVYKILNMYDCEVIDELNEIQCNKFDSSVEF